MAKTMTVGELLDTLAAINCARDDVDPPMTDDEWRALKITIELRNDPDAHSGTLRDVSIEQRDGGEVLVFSASDEED